MAQICGPPTPALHSAEITRTVAPSQATIISSQSSLRPGRYFHTAASQCPHIHKIDDALLSTIPCPSTAELRETLCSCTFPSGETQVLRCWTNCLKNHMWKKELRCRLSVASEHLVNWVPCQKASCSFYLPCTLELVFTANLHCRVPCTTESNSGLSLGNTCNLSPRQGLWSVFFPPKGLYSLLWYFWTLITDKCPTVNNKMNNFWHLLSAYYMQVSVENNLPGSYHWILPRNGMKSWFFNLIL